MSLGYLKLRHLFSFVYGEILQSLYIARNFIYVCILREIVIFLNRIIYQVGIFRCTLFLMGLIFVETDSAEGERLCC